MVSDDTVSNDFARFRIINMIIKTKITGVSKEKKSLQIA